jgi:hypothetical protein
MYAGSHAPTFMPSSGFFYSCHFNLGLATSGFYQVVVAYLYIRVPLRDLHNRVGL